MRKSMESTKILEEARGIRKETEERGVENIYKEVKERLFKPFLQLDYEKEKMEGSEGGNEISLSKIEMNEEDKDTLYLFIDKWVEISVQE